MRKVELGLLQHKDNAYSLTLKMKVGQHLMVTTGKYSIEVHIFGLTSNELIELGIGIAQLLNKGQNREDEK